MWADGLQWIVWFVMVIELSGLQFGQKSYTWTIAQCELDLESQVWFQTKIAQPVQVPLYYIDFEITQFTTVFVDTRLWKTKHLWKHFQNFRQSCMLSTDQIEIHPITATSVTFRPSKMVVRLLYALKGVSHSRDIVCLVSIKL